MRRHLGKIILAHIQIHPQVIQIRDRKHIPFRPAIADKSGGDEFADFDVSFQHGRIHRRADDRVVEVDHRQGEAPFQLMHDPFLGGDDFLARSEPGEFQLLPVRFHLGLARQGE